ncbi:hypothetical protein GPK34_01025 [Secundilactobacillus kimchicus]|uniref:hypothetical protein n=1 Tax=Secundilactobacillus kimchicus TaxID=528209 RepID=UPI001C01825A|nr:hypothetical protein [Secundilactobacillus kimchicus]MBT9670620.1 hypothetical protein [Secundilactobacillus kimchicus]
MEIKVDKRERQYLLDLLEEEIQANNVFDSFEKDMVDTLYMKIAMAKEVTDDEVRDAYS